jgi:hypothetical protein
MQQIGNEEHSAKSGSNHSDKGHHLTKGDVIGGAMLAIFVAGVLSGYYAYNYITKDSPRISFWATFMLTFTGLVVVVIQVAIYAQQARFMREQVNVTRIAERGYIGIEAVKLVNGLTIGERPIVRITFRNGGRTPVWNIMHPTRIRIGTTFPPGRPKQISAEGGGFLPAGLTRDSEMIIDRLVTQEFIDDITNGRVKIFINGETHFKDCWNESRIESFKLVYAPRVGQFADYHPRPDDLQEQGGDWSLPISDEADNAKEDGEA